jgi:hypothetical protein
MKTVKFSEQRTAVGYSESFHNEGIAVSCKLFHFAQCIAWVWLIFIHAYKDLVYGPVQVGGGGGCVGGEFRKDDAIERMSLECGHNKDIQANDFQISLTLRKEKNIIHLCWQRNPFSLPSAIS